MPRIDIQTSSDSPLRRSSRTAAGSAGTPSSVKTRRTSLLAQENDPENDGKTAPRTRRASSVTKEEKQEPARTRTRRSSANIEVPVTDEKRQPPSKGRRSSITEQSPDLSKEETKIEENTIAKKTRARRSSAAEENTQEDSPAPPKGRATRGRRLSVENIENAVAELPKRATRSTRRNSVDNVEGEPEQKISKPSTPKKPKRRLSVTETVVPMEPITEQDAELSKVVSKSLIDVDGNEVEKPVNTEPAIQKTNLDLSIINETENESFSKTSKSPTNELNQSSNESLKVILTPIKMKDQQRPTVELEVIVEESQVFTPKSEVLAVDDNPLGLRKVSPINRKTLTPQKLSFSEDSEKIAVGKVSTTIVDDDNVFVDTPTSLSFKGPSDATGADFSPSLRNESVKTNCSQDGADDEISLDISNNSDKENIGVENNAEGVKTVSALEPVKVTRISDVFKPRNIENNFVEPMEVDESIIVTNENCDNIKSIENKSDATPEIKQTPDETEFFSAVAEDNGNEIKATRDEIKEQGNDQPETESNKSDIETKEVLENITSIDIDNSFKVVTTKTEDIANAKDPESEIQITMSMNKNDVSQDFDFDVPSDEENDDEDKEGNESKVVDISLQNSDKTVAKKNEETTQKSTDRENISADLVVIESPKKNLVTNEKPIDKDINNVETERKSNETITVSEQICESTTSVDIQPEVKEKQDIDNLNEIEEIETEIEVSIEKEVVMDSNDSKEIEPETEETKDTSLNISVIVNSEVKVNEVETKRGETEDSIEMINYETNKVMTEMNLKENPVGDKTETLIDEMEESKKDNPKRHVSISDDENEKNNKIEAEVPDIKETESKQDGDSSIIEVTENSDTRTDIEKNARPMVTEEPVGAVDLELEKNDQASDIIEIAELSGNITDIKEDEMEESAQIETNKAADICKGNVSVSEEVIEPEVPIQEEDDRNSQLSESKSSVNETTSETEVEKKSKTKVKPKKISTKSNSSESDVFIESPLIEFANSKLDKYLNEKMQEMGEEEEEEIDEEEIDEEESETSQSGFIDDMAKEGEEDTPSEDSNEIVDEGESIHSESESSEDDYDSNDSFICDEEHFELLSGDEYDLGDSNVKPKKRRRIINVDNCDDDVITLPLRNRKGKSSRLKKTRDRRKHSEEESVEIVEKPEEPDSVQSNNVVKKSAITIQENISVGDIQDPVLSKRINELVESFSRSINEGDVSISLTMEYEGQKSSASSDVVCIDDSEDSESAKLGTNRRRKSEQIIGGSPNKKPRLSVSLDTSQDTVSADEKSHSMSRRKSLSTDDLHLRKIHKKKMKQAKRKLKTDLLRDVGENSLKKNLSAQGLRKETFNLMNHLLNDIINRPRRGLKPSSSKHHPDESWSEDRIGDLKPSTSMVSKKEIQEYQAKKIHDKDFKSQMLNDPTRIKRMETKTILKKKGAQF